LDRFLTALEQARLSDTVYRDELNAIDDDPEGEDARRVERRLKDRVRTQIGLPPLVDGGIGRNAAVKMKPDEFVKGSLLPDTSL
jgi:hypothetical protein